MRQSETDEVLEAPEPETEADAAPAPESTFAAPIVGPGPETAAPVEDVPAEPVAEEPALEAEPVAEEAVAPEADEAPVETTLEADEPLEDIPTEPVAEEPALETEPEHEVDEPEAATAFPDTTSAAGVAVGAAGVAAAGLFTRLDQRIEADDAGLEAEQPVEHVDPELDPNASVFDRPDLIDAQEDAVDEAAYEEITDSPQAFANSNEVCLLYTSPSPRDS